VSWLFRLLLAASVIAAPAPGASGTPAPAGAPTYQKILELYRAGHFAEAIAAVAPMGRSQIIRESGWLVEQGVRESKLGRPRLWLQTAAMVHLEYALSLEDEPGREALEKRGVHVRAALEFVHVLSYPPRQERPHGPGTDEAFIRAFFLFLGAQNTFRESWRNADSDISKGLDVIGEDAELLLAQGALHEFAWRQVHDEDRLVSGFTPDLAQAEQALQKAVAVDPRLDEARLRLGRVQALRGESEAALHTLAALRIPETENGFVYLARLFEGDIHETRGRAAEAEQAYLAAVALMPGAQSAQMALAQILHASGRRADAMRRVTTLGNGGRMDASDDPWLLYMRGVGWRRAGYLNALRAMVRS
jgi:tetratricopeptide (TPR) repeat protein